MNDADAAKRSVRYFTGGKFFYALTPSSMNVELSDTGLFEYLHQLFEKYGLLTQRCDPEKGFDRVVGFRGIPASTARAAGGRSARACAIFPTVFVLPTSEDSQAVVVCSVMVAVVNNPHNGRAGLFSRPTRTKSHCGLPLGWIRRLYVRLVRCLGRTRADLVARGCNSRSVGDRGFAIRCHHDAGFCGLPVRGGRPQDLDGRTGVAKAPYRYPARSPLSVRGTFGDGPVRGCTFEGA